MKKIGVLALQGDFAKHGEMLQKLGVFPIEVRTPFDLEKCEGLILPGGESTSLSLQLEFMGLKGAIAQFASQKPLFGTCAGLILMAKKITGGGRVLSFNLFDLTVSRNAYGRQLDSFHKRIEWKGVHPKSIEAIFIRAPKIVEWNLNVVKVLGSLEEQPVIVQQQMGTGPIHLGACFHPELTGDLTLHEYFISLIG